MDRGIEYPDFKREHFIRQNSKAIKTIIRLNMNDENKNIEIPGQGKRPDQYSSSLVLFIIIIIGLILTILIHNITNLPIQ